jgi:hypothetical protein
MRISSEAIKGDVATSLTCGYMAAIVLIEHVLAEVHGPATGYLATSRRTTRWSSSALTMPTMSPADQASEMQATYVRAACLADACANVAPH